MELYTRAVVDHFLAPRCTSALARVDATGEARSTDPDCPDHVRVTLQIDAETVTGVRQETEGCVATTAGASRLCELVLGRPVADVRALSVQQLREDLGGLPAHHKTCLDVPVRALKNALDAVVNA